MFDSVVSWFTSFQFTSFMGILLYWVPLLMCTISYFIETIGDYQRDYAERERLESDDKIYTPSLTFGTIIARVLKAVIPVLNLACLVFDVFWRHLRFIGNLLETTFNQPLVPAKKKRGLNERGSY